MTICFFGIYDPKYPRNDILLSGLSRLGVEVVECRADWRDPWRYVTLYKKLRALKNQYEYIYAAYPSPLPTILARLISSKPVIADAFYSMFDAVVNDRCEISWWHPRALKLLVVDWLGVMCATAVTTDTEAHKQYWSGWWGVNGRKIHTLYLGVNDEFFHPLPEKKKDYFLVHFHGKYIPVQGVEKIIEAAHWCVDEPQIRFRLVGTGQTFKKAENLVELYQLHNVELIPRSPVPSTELNAYMGEADMILGVFGDTAKSGRVIPNKVYEGLASRRAVMTMDCPAIREIFSDADMLLVKNDPSAIAEGIRMLFENQKMRQELGERGYTAVQNYFPVPVATSLVNLLSRIF